MLEYLRAIDALPRAISEGQVLGVALHERSPLHEPARRLRQQRLREIEPATPGIGYLGQDVSGAAADLQHSIPGACSEQGQDATDPLALDVPDQRARVIVELLDVVLLDHRVVPRLELAEIAKGARATDRPTDRGVDTNRPAFTCPASLRSSDKVAEPDQREGEQPVGAEQCRHDEREEA